MKKIIIFALACNVMLWSCNKKQDIAPDATQAAEVSKGDATIKAKSFEEKLLEASDAFAPQVSNVTANSAVVTLGKKSLFVEQEGDEVFVSTMGAGNARIDKQSFSSKMGDGQFAGVMINITKNNVDEFVDWLTQEDPSPFEVLFGKTLNTVFTSGPESDTKVSIELNPAGLPKGAFLLKGKIQAKANGSGTCQGQDCGLVKSGKKVSITANAGLFGFYIDNQLYGQTNGVDNIAFLMTNKLSKKDYVYANGVRTYGSDNGESANSFAWVLGLGKGTGTPPLTGIVIAVAVNKSKTSAVFTLGAFQGLKIK